jgi:D-alanyl-lipoteichoic acid acyltransferase DltB (MBOAT superfamily)
VLFNSFEYIFLFLPLVLLGYFSIARISSVAATAFLVLSSLVFYAYWNPIYLLLLLGSMTFNFHVGRHIIRSKSRAKKLITGLGVLSNLGLLAYFKYCNFFIDNLNALVGSDISFLQLILPLAISFFTFQQIAYLVDSYKGKVEDYDFATYALFVSFFPQLIAGPIVHHKEMMPQFLDIQNKYINWDNVAKGLLLFVLGLFKKLFIADNFAVWANAGFGASEGITFFQAWGASLSYSLQLYYDFSGYTDMAIGAALMFNICLPINFNSPYKAIDIQDFWRRWHMTLSRWLRDYVYIPLGGNLKSVPNTYVNLFVTFLLGGLWHGAGWNFIIWGALHGGALMLHRAWRGSQYKMPRNIAWLLMLLFVNLTWVFFRAEDFTIAKNMIEGMLGLNGIAVSHGFAQMWNYLIVFPSLYVEAKQSSFIIPNVALFFILFFGWVTLKMPNTMNIAGFVEYKGKWIFNPSVKIACGLAFLFLVSIVLLAANDYSEFLYFNF